MKSLNNWFISVSVISCFTACIGDVSAMFWFGSQYPGYSQLKNTMSSLGASTSPVSDQMSLSWIIVGLLFVVFAMGFRKAFSAPGNRVKIPSWLIIIYGLGEGLGSGLFKGNHIGNTLTDAGIVHDILGGIGVAAILILPIFMNKLFAKKQHPLFHKFSWIVFIFGVFALALFSFRFLPVEDNLLVVYKGLWQRMLIWNYYIYLLSIALFMMNRKFTA